MRFWFFLSTRFGLPVAVLKRVMPYAEFLQHIAYYRLHPYGDDWQQAALTSWCSLDVHNRKRVKPESFIPRVVRKVAQTPEYIFGVFKQMAIDAEARRNAKRGRTINQ